MENLIRAEGSFLEVLKEREHSANSQGFDSVVHEIRNWNLSNLAKGQLIEEKELQNIEQIKDPIEIKDGGTKDSSLVKNVNGGTFTLKKDDINLGLEPILKDDGRGHTATTNEKRNRADSS